VRQRDAYVSLFSSQVSKVADSMSGNPDSIWWSSAFEPSAQIFPTYCTMDGYYSNNLVAPGAWNLATPAFLAEPIGQLPTAVDAFNGSFPTGVETISPRYRSSSSLLLTFRLCSTINHITHLVAVPL